jgi:hypothetical protein
MELIVAYPELPGTLTHVANSAGMPAVACELGDFYGIRPLGESGEAALARRGSEVGFSGVKNVMMAMDMVEGESPEAVRQVRVSPETGLGPTHPGLLYGKIDHRDIGRVLKGGTLLGEIIDPYTFDVIEEIRAPFEETIVIAATHGDPVQYVQAGHGDFGYYVADWKTAEWL